MKKLILTLSAAVIAGMVQAATVTWSSGTMFKPTSGTDGTFTETKATTKASSYFYELTPQEYASFLAMDYATGSAAIFEAYKDETPDAIGTNGASTPKNQFKTGVGTILTEASANDKIYAAIIYRYVDTNNNMDMYVANLAYGEVGSQGYNITVDEIGLQWAGEGKATIDAWTNAAVPEPTSGLLLLLGVAGLALKRKRA